MSIPYLEDQYQNKYEFKEVNRKAKIHLSGLMKDIKKLREDGDTEEVFTKIEELAYAALKGTYPNLTQEEYENLLDFNEKKYGFSQLYELLGEGINSVFTRAGYGEQVVHPYLKEKEELEKNNQVQAVEE